MKVYRIRHKPTGLFFKPTAKRFTKNNLHKEGKVYTRKPSLSHLKDGYRVEKEPHEIDTQRGRDTYKTLPFIEDEWEIVEYDISTED